MFHFVYFLPALLAESPVFLAELAGAVVALVRYSRHPRQSLMVVLGLAAMFLSRLLRVLAQTVLPVMMMQRRMQAQGGGIVAIADLVLVLIEAGGLALVIAAALQPREPR